MFSGYKQCQLVRNRRFGDQIHPHSDDGDGAGSWNVDFYQLTLFIAREDFIIGNHVNNNFT